MGSRTYRAAVIGCGRIGADCGPPASGSSRIASHAAAYAASDRTELVAGCDPDDACLQRFGARWGVDRLYTELGELLDREAPDLISVCSPTDMHLAVLEEVVARGTTRALLLEKPVARSLSDANRAVALGSGSSVKVAVNYIRRFPPVYREIRRSLQQQSLGRIQHVTALYTKGVLNNGTHVFDLLRFLFGEPEDMAMLPGETVASSDPTLSLVVTLPEGFPAWLRGLDGEATNVFELDVIGTDGRLVVRDQGHIVDTYHVDGDAWQRHGFHQWETHPVSASTDLRHAIRYAVDDLVSSVESGAQPACTLSDGLAAVALAHRALDLSRADAPQALNA